MGEKNWQFGHINKVRFTHSPFSETPLKSGYEMVAEQEGNGRTLNMAFAQKWGKNGPFVAIAGSVYRQIIDLGDP